MPGPPPRRAAAKQEQRNEGARTGNAALALLLALRPSSPLPLAACLAASCRISRSPNYSTNRLPDVFGDQMTLLRACYSN